MSSDRPIARTLFAAIVAAGLAGCTAQPMLDSSTPSGLAMGQALATIAVSAPSSRSEQVLTNRLIFLLSGGAGQPADPAWRLTVSASSRITGAAVIQVGGAEQPTSSVVTMTGSYTLETAAGEQVAKGTRLASAAFDVPRQGYVRTQAQADAEDRAATELAEMIRLAVAQAIASR